MDLENYIQLAGPLFEAVQKAELFSDSKTFVDATPKAPPSTILKAYQASKKLPTFNLKNFIMHYFELPPKIEAALVTAPTMKEYIEITWQTLLKDMKASSPYSTLISLPYPHIVPGGRFRECFYWDSYFTALGLSSPQHLPLVKMMVENFAYLIDLLGFIPNGNRVYFATRSQPPYFSFLLTMLFELGEETFALQHFNQLEKEYQYWMEHAITLDTHLSLNHYFDSAQVARPEAYQREMALASTSHSPQFFRHLRAACASGWDFSSRWLEDTRNFQTIEALNILPVDLNCLLFHLEETLDRFSKLLGKNSEKYALAAEKRKHAIQTLFWKDDFFFDYHYLHKNHTPIHSLAAATPLFVKACTQKQADRVAQKLKHSFLLKGGFVTSLTESPHQWDMPNGWAPLQWITVQGLLHYGYDALAIEGARRWLDLNEKIFLQEGTLFEKYNVRDCSVRVTRGEYALQQGFGWTNGVALKLMEVLLNGSKT